MNLGTTAADASVFPHLGSSLSSPDVDTRVDDDADDGSQRVRIQPIDTKLNLHFKKTQASRRRPCQRQHDVLCEVDALPCPGPLDYNQP